MLVWLLFFSTCSFIFGQVRRHKGTSPHCSMSVIFFSIIFISPIVPAIFINEWGCRYCLGSETLRREKDDHVREEGPLITSSICHYLYCSNLFQGWLQISWINLIEYNKGSWTLTCEGIFFFTFNLTSLLFWVFFQKRAEPSDWYPRDY